MASANRSPLPTVLDSRGELEFGITTLRPLCDSVRASLRDNRTLGPREGEIQKLLLAVVKGEYAGSSILSFANIRDSHSDKLLLDMMEVRSSTATTSDEYRANNKIAHSLQKHWQIRFRDEYFRIDHERLRRLLQTGRLKDVEFVGPRPGSCELWQAKTEQVTTGLEGPQTLRAGHWWLNLACAHRDGIVGSVSETPTKGRYDHAALPLMTGKEDVYVNKVKYCRYGTMADMHISLMSRVSKEICVLRGSGLFSPLAPRAGVRYDGKYRIKAYSIVWKPQMGMYQLELEMTRSILESPATERPPGTKDGEVKQPHMKEVVQAPTPSEMDEWRLYEMYETELLRQRLGSTVFMDWYQQKAAKQFERDHWRRMNELRLDLGKLWEAMGV
ncbi:hypothetical protein CC79DRAFT_1362287 [Sarocladium strictum]